jgi:hypothetical protein
MIRITANTNLFRKDMMNIIDYSLGFLDGINRGKSKFFNTIGALTSDSLKNFIDINAKLNPAMLQHVYEWYQVGSPEARLYNISYNAKDSGVSLSSTFSQSSTIKDGSNVPFYDKARIMENGVPVLISPKTSGVLVFEDNGETVFTKKDVLVTNPGGRAAVGGFEKTFDLFFQMNTLSLLGYYGPEVKKLSNQLLDLEMYDFLGTDTHRIEHLKFTKNTPLQIKPKNKTQIETLVQANQQFSKITF